MRRPIHAVVLNGKNSARAGAERRRLFDIRGMRKKWVSCAWEIIINISTRTHTHTYTLAASEPTRRPTPPVAKCNILGGIIARAAPQVLRAREMREAFSSSSSSWGVGAGGEESICVRVCEWSAPASIHITHSVWIRAHTHTRHVWHTLSCTFCALFFLHFMYAKAGGVYSYERTPPALGENDGAISRSNHTGCSVRSCHSLSPLFSSCS